MQTQRRDREAGVGLIEIVIAVVLLGTAIAALSATLITGVRASTSHRELTTIDTVLRSHAEAIKGAVRDQCTTGGNWTSTYPGAMPGGYSVAPSGGVCPPGATQVDLVVSGPNVSKSMSIVVRQP